MTKAALRRFAALLAALTVMINLSSCTTYNPIKLVDSVISAIIQATQPKPDWLIEAEQFTDYAQPAEFRSLLDDRSIIDEQGVQYDLLTEPQKTAYSAMYDAALVLSPVAFSVGECSDGDIAIAFSAFVRDHPEIFWIGSSYGVITYGDEAYVSFVDEDSYGYLCRDEEQRDDRLQMIEKAASAAIEDIYTQGMDEYELALAAYNWTCLNVEYDQPAADADIDERSEQHIDSWSLFNAFIKGKGVCVAYAKTFQYLCGQLGIDCSVIVGDAVNSDGETEAHMWNVAKIDGKWYYFDPTWDSHDDEFVELTHIYFGITGDAMAEDHTAYKEPDGTFTDDELQKGDYNLFLPEAEAELGYYERTGAIVDINKEPDLQIAVKAAKNSYYCEILFTNDSVSDKQIEQYIESVLHKTKMSDVLKYAYVGYNNALYASVNDKVYLVKFIDYQP